MKKLSNYLNESEKQSFTKKVTMELENGIVLETNISVSDLNEVSAQKQIQEILTDKKIKNINVFKITESIDVTENIIKPVNEICSYYIPWNQVFEKDEVRYDVTSIIESLKDNDDIISIHIDNQYGWHNQPEVIILQLKNEDKKILEKTTNILKHTLRTEWVRISKVDW